MTKKYFIQQYMQEEYLHGGVGGADAERILLAKGFAPIYFPHHRRFSLFAKMSRFRFLFKTFWSIREGSVVVFLYPVYATMILLLLKWLSKKKDVRCICFIADIDGIKDGDDRLLSKEIRFFRRFKYFIVHNERMKEWVLKNISDKSRVFDIEFFDFLATSIEPRRNISLNIVFAGNLSKSLFLDKLYLLEKDHPGLHFHLYGPGNINAVAKQPNVTWHGVVKPIEVPSQLSGSFGLLWDGTSIETPAGSHGIYMQFISHHKLSLYILSKLPVIAPASSAAALLIQKYQIGLTINSLYEIGEKIKALSPADYLQMQKNMIPLSERISMGQCLGKAIDEILQ